MDVTKKPFEFLEFEVWDNPEVFSLPHPNHECLLDPNTVEIRLSF